MVQYDCPPAGSCVSLPNGFIIETRTISNDFPYIRIHPRLRGWGVGLGSIILLFFSSCIGNDAGLPAMCAFGACPKSPIFRSVGNSCLRNQLRICFLYVGYLYHSMQLLRFCLLQMVQPHVVYFH